MEEFKYKEYTQEEDKIHEEAIAKIRDGLNNGMNFNEACSAVDIEDAELKGFIVDDALKITLAEMHYAKGLTLQQVADELKIPLKAVSIAHMEMLQDVAIAAAEEYRRSTHDNPMGNA